MIGQKAQGLSNQPVIEVLLATYNGDRFLREQISSILAQDYSNIRVLARDDGSTDETANILKEYARRFPDSFRVMPHSPGTGSPKDNFLLLMQESSAPYVCFSDQDDVWLPDKVSKTKQAMDQLESRWGVDVPLLVFTDLRVVDDQLKILHESFWANEGIEPSYIDQLALTVARNVVTGCTAMLNRRLLDLSRHMPKEASMHDHWIALVASAMGKSSSLRKQTVLYRQHDRNVFGAEKKTKSLPALIRRIRRSDGRASQWEISQRQVEAFLRTYGDDLSVKNRDLLMAYLRCGTSKSRLVRIAILIRYGFYRAGLMRNAAILMHLWTMKVKEPAEG
jgi:glycosyltransferase involved in cell wall biosynthesis